MSIATPRNLCTIILPYRLNTLTSKPSAARGNLIFVGLRVYVTDHAERLNQYPTDGLLSRGLGYQICFLYVGNRKMLRNSRWIRPNSMNGELCYFHDVCESLFTALKITPEGSKVTRSPRRIGMLDTKVVQETVLKAG